MTHLSASVLIPSFRRPAMLARCLRALAAQRTPPAEVLVVWQADDEPTREAAEALAGELPYRLRVLHSQEAGVVPAENVALEAASGEVVLLIDDDAVAGPEWLARHLAHYADPTVGAVGGPADNFRPDGAPYPRRDAEPVGRLTWYGRPLGNAYDQPESWRQRPPREVDHLVGYNLSLRRSAFGRFQTGLRRYWQLFELEACLQVKARGYRVLFDFANVVEHHPTNTAYCGGRDGDLDVKVYNAAYNHALVLALHSPWWLRPARLAYLLLAGSTATPGVLGCLWGMRRYGRPLRELGVLGRTWRAVWQGWLAGRAARRQGCPATAPRTSGMEAVA
jgi:glycosyltransferase involved in cell wall biosynthesis